MSGPRLLERTIHDFVLDISPHGENVSVRAACPSLVGELEPVVVERCTVSRLAKDGCQLESPDGLQLREAADLGRRLFDLVFTEGPGLLWDRAISALRTPDEGLRLLIQLPADSDLHQIPWELLCRGQRFLATRGGVTLVRYLKQKNPVRSLALRGTRLRVLMTSASPEGHEPIDFRKEAQILKGRLRPSRSGVQLLVEHHVSFDRLTRILRRAAEIGRPIHLWHHCGHGARTDDDEFRLVLEREGRAELVPGADLERRLRHLPGLRMAVLNTCFSGGGEGLARALAGLGLGLVIGFRSLVYDPLARLFASALYEKLLTLAADQAAQWARASLYQYGETSLEWAQLLIFARTLDARLFDAAGKRSAIGGTHGR